MANPRSAVDACGVRVTRDQSADGCSVYRSWPGERQICGFERLCRVGLPVILERSGYPETAVPLVSTIMLFEGLNA
jgi:hypothetical protein